MEVNITRNVRIMLNTERRKEEREGRGRRETEAKTEDMFKQQG